MKTTRLVLSLLAVLALAGSASAANYEVKAKAAAKAAGCITNGQKDIVVNTEVVSACFASGFITKATVIWVPQVRCTEEPCPRPLATVVAEVMFGCDDEVMSVTCY